MSLSRYLSFRRCVCILFPFLSPSPLIPALAIYLHPLLFHCIAPAHLPLPAGHSPNIFLNHTASRNLTLPRPIFLTVPSLLPTLSHYSSLSSLSRPLSLSLPPSLALSLSLSLPTSLPPSLRLSVPPSLRPYLSLLYSLLHSPSLTPSLTLALYLPSSLQPFLTPSPSLCLSYQLGY